MTDLPDSPIRDIGWARRHLMNNPPVAVRRRSWPSALKLRIASGVIIEQDDEADIDRRWSPLQADVLALDWELAQSCANTGA